MRKGNLNPRKSNGAKKEPEDTFADLEDKDGEESKKSPPDLTPDEQLKENETVTDNWLF
jgi:hypothetical protein